MTGAVSHWLKARGFEVWTEIPCLYRLVDIVAYDGKTIMGIEMKTGFCRKGLQQCRSVCIAFDKMWLAVAAKPQESSVSKCAESSIGLLWVRQETCEIVLNPKINAPIAHWRQKVMAILETSDPGGIAGKPCLAGEGPAQRCEQRIAIYREEHPKATWFDLYREIPNHYVSVASMRGAMYMLRQRRAWKARRSEFQQLPKGGRE